MSAKVTREELGNWLLGEDKVKGFDGARRTSSEIVQEFSLTKEAAQGQEQNPIRSPYRQGKYERMLELGLRTVVILRS